MNDKGRKNRNVTQINGDVNTGGGDFVGRDKVTNIVVDGKLMHIPGAIKAISLQASPRNEMHQKSPLSLGDSIYVVHEIIASAELGNILARTARAADQSLQEDVGILHLKLIAGADTGRLLSFAQRRAQNINLAAGQSRSLAGIRKIIISEQELWVVSHWPSGARSWKKEYMDGPLPGELDIHQMLTWSIAVCDALSALHRRHELHGGISAETIVRARNRDVVLTQAWFAGNLSKETLFPTHFDPQVDLRAFGLLLHQTLTHQPDGHEPASSYNLQVPPELDTLIENIKAGAIKHVPDLKHRLIQIRKNIGS